MMATDIFKDIELVEDGFSIEIEIVSKFLKKHKSVIEVPIKYEGDPIWKVKK